MSVLLHHLNNPFKNTAEIEDPSHLISENLLQTTVNGIEMMKKLNPEFINQAATISHEISSLYLDKGRKNISQHTQTIKKLEQFHNDLLDHLTDQAFPERFFAQPSLRFRKQIHQLENKYKKTNRLRSKLILQKTQASYQNFNKLLERGIEDIVNKIILAEKLGCQPVDITSNDIMKRADQNMKVLIEEEEKNKKSSQNSEKKLPHKKKSTVNQKNKVLFEKKRVINDISSPSSLNNPISKKNQNDKTLTEKKSVNKETSLSPLTSLESKLSKFALELMHDSFRYPEQPRVRRWDTRDMNQIRLFEDKVDGQSIFRYQNLSEDQLFEQYVRHYLPGTEKVLKDPTYRAIYAFPTDRGFGMVAQLLFNDTIHNGILYFGITANKKKVIFHKYCEDVNFQDSTINVFRDEEKTYVEEKEAGENWESTQDFCLEISKDGVIQLTYATHTISLFPIRKDLFSKKIATFV